MPHIVIIIGIILAASVVVIVTGFFTIFFVTCLLEKHYVKQLVSCDSSRLTTASSYCSAVIQQATALGFKDLGTFAQDRNSKLYSGLIGFWLSSDGLTLARIAGGKTAKISIKRTSLVSWGANGKRLVTADSHTINDVSGLTNEEVLMHAHLPELYGRHQQRLADAAFDAHIIPDTNILAICEARDAARILHLNEMGFVKLLNPEGTIWRYNLKAAWQICFVDLCKQMRNATQNQERRRRLKRPGDV